MGIFRIFTALLLLGAFSINAQAVVINPDQCGGTLTCWNVSTTSSLDADDVELIVVTSAQLSLFYKQDFGGGESGSFSDNYTTTFTGFESGEPTGANITHTGGSSISCPECYLVVKDGNNGSPSQYVIDISSWNGLDILALSGFWDGTGIQGSISHVAIFGGVSAIPVPAAFWLFGTALIGFVGMSRRTRV